MGSHIDVAIIGSGPYGLSIAAHLHAAKVDNRVFGVPMEAWATHMPQGMHLKSDAQASSLSDPNAAFTLETYCSRNKIAYHDYQIPVRLEDFTAYGLEFQRRFVPSVEQRRLLSLRSGSDGFALEFDSGEVVNAKKVVIATGVVAFKHSPSAIAQLPEAVASHSADHRSLEKFNDREVAIIGAGSSALDLGALLALRGARVTLIARTRVLRFQPTPSVNGSSALMQIVRRILMPPSHGLGNGWLMRICAESPQVIHLAPDWVRRLIVAKTLGPSGGHFVRDRIERDVQVITGSTVVDAHERAGRVVLSLANEERERQTISCDHVVAATGYKVDLRRLGFFNAKTLAGLKTTDYSPVLSRRFESSVPGLYFVGLAAARSFGPALRFVMGAIHPARTMAYELPKSLSKYGRSRMFSLEG